MEMLIVFMAIVVMVACFIFGIRSERYSWTMRGDRHSNHFCNGKMYYVTTEAQHINDMERWIKHGGVSK